jgi:DNA-binding Lrp family transcriptional regulator
MKKDDLGLDEIDKRIIIALEENCRDSLSKVAESLGISKRVLEYRVSRLMKKGVIIGYAAVFDYSKLGYINHEVWMQLKRIDKRGKEEFIQHLIDNPDIGWVAECGGRYDCAIGVMARDTVTFSRILREIISQNPDTILNYYIAISTKIFTYKRSYLLKGTDRTRRGKVFFSGPPEKVFLDDIDKRLIMQLSKNAKMSAIDLAKKAKISHNTVRRRIQSLETRRIIKGYKAIVQPTVIGYRNYEVLLNISCMSKEDEEKIERYCRSNPYVTMMIQCIGRWDLNLALDARDFDHFLEMLAELRTELSGSIRDFEYVFIMNVRKFQYRVG